MTLHKTYLLGRIEYKVITVFFILFPTLIPSLIIFNSALSRSLLGNKRDLSNKKRINGNCSQKVNSSVEL